MRFLLYLLLSFSLFLSSCENKNGTFTIFSTDDDIQLGKTIRRHIESNPDQFPLLERDDYPELYGHLDRIKDNVISSNEILHRDEFAWEIHVIENDTLYNAFCTPGGYIYVFTGLIRFVKSEDELAGILGHEIAHGDLRHSTNQMTKALGLKVIAAIITGGEGEQLANLGVNLLGLKFSRADESEADEYSVKYLSETDYNPRAFAVFFKRMDAIGEENQPLQFLSTHPDPGNRVEAIEKYWRQNGAKKGKDFSKSFLNLVNSLP